jgi:hypothetical protein
MDGRCNCRQDTTKKAATSKRKKYSKGARGRRVVSSSSSSDSGMEELILVEADAECPYCDQCFSTDKRRELGELYKISPVVP